MRQHSQTARRVYRVNFGTNQPRLIDAMESSSSRLEEERRRQDDLRKQIASLQAQLKEIPKDPLVVPEPGSPVSTPKRKPSDAGPLLLVPPTPSPSKC